jgi:aromatic ring-opening dioxygenase catalytic subunit (LigB family)
VLATKPKALIVVSAHWEAPSYLGGGVQINNDSSNPLIHDFYGFPKQYYELKFHSRADASVVDHVKNTLHGKIKVDEIPRGLDHGLYCASKRC